MKRKLAVAVARDVLVQLRAKRYVATQGTYVDSDNIPYGHEYEDFKSFFKENKQVKCQVCALGSCFVSLVNLENKASVAEVFNEDSMYERLEEIFDPNNLIFMERVFETIIIPYDLSDPMDQAIQLWCRKYENPSERLQAIMKNIIRNNGMFKLPQKLLRQRKAMPQ